MVPKAKRRLLFLSASIAGALFLAAFLAGRAAGRLEALIARQQAHQAALRSALARGPAQARAEKPAATTTTAAAALQVGPPLRKKPPEFGEYTPYKINPNLVNLLKRWSRSEAMLAYGAFFRAQGLPRDQLEKFADLQAEYRAREVDLLAAAEEEHLPDNGPVFRSLQHDLGQQLLTEESALLGSANVAALKDFNRMEPARNSAIGLFASMAQTDPLTLQQVDQLTQALAGASPDYRSGGRVYMPGVDWNAVDHAAQVILTPAQFATFQNSSYDTNSGRPSADSDKIFEAALAADKAKSQAH